jgi:hypothetical protein
MEMLEPLFADSQSLYLTGTYCDEYGLAHGCMLTRNVHKDFFRFLKEIGFRGACVVGVEPHRDRDIKHLHAILRGPFVSEKITLIGRGWEDSGRGWARALPVLDKCVSYVTKYALKGDSDAFEFRGL